MFASHRERNRDLLPILECAYLPYLEAHPYQTFRPRVHRNCVVAKPDGSVAYKMGQVVPNTKVSAFLFVLLRPM